MLNEKVLCKTKKVSLDILDKYMIDQGWTLYVNEYYKDFRVYQKEYNNNCFNTVMIPLNDTSTLYAKRIYETLKLVENLGGASVREQLDILL